MSNISADIYGLTQFVKDIQAKHMDEVPAETLSMGMYGYLAEIDANMLQNAVVIASQLSNEAIPTRAKFDKNIITHALSLGITDINAIPSTMKVLLCFPESYLLNNMTNDSFTYDKDIKIYMEDYEFHTDYDIIISRNKLINGSYVYTAQYDMAKPNALSSIDSPYLPPVAVFALSKNEKAVVITTTISQVEYTQIHNKIITDNTIENKTLTFDFENQLAGFDIEVREGDETYYLYPVYDGLTVTTSNLYFYYSYLDNNTIRIKFDRSVYEPRINCDIDINVYTTHGKSGNFKYREDLIVNLESSRFSYDSLYMVIKQRGTAGAINGQDQKSIQILQSLIPKETTSRGNITNNTDLENFFNNSNNATSTIHIDKKRHNQLEMLYYIYALIKDTSSNIVPTNTISVKLSESDFTNTDDNLVLAPGTKIGYVNGVGEIANPATTYDFVYMNPYTCIVNNNPLYAAYYIDIIDDTKYLSFDYINQDTDLQFMASSIDCKRSFITDRNKYKFSIAMSQNIAFDYGMIVKDAGDNITENKVKVIGLVYNSKSDATPYRYIVAELSSYEDYGYVFDFNLNTDNNITFDTKIKILNTYEPTGTTVTEGYFNGNSYIKIYILAKMDQVYGNKKDIEQFVPGLEEYTLCNIYSVPDGIDFFYNYSDNISSNVSVNSSNVYTVSRMPVVKYDYVNSEDRMKLFIDETKSKLLFAEECVKSLETPFGIDFKLFNTYGPSKTYKISDSNLIDKVNLTMNFNIRLFNNTDNYIIDYIIKDIKEYMEDINTISDLHMPKLISQINNDYREQIIYFEFTGLNSYGPANQHVTLDTSTAVNTTDVPEFLNINTLADGTPDINIAII